jgi:hypothetical protein
MIASFFASQQTFCFLQLQGNADARAKAQSATHNHDEDIIITTKDLVKRPADSSGLETDGLNLKTPSGPQPHPSWVYRGNYAPFNPNRTDVCSVVKRSASKLGKTSNKAMAIAQLASYDHRLDLNGTMSKSSVSSSTGNRRIGKFHISTIPIRLI